MNAQFYPNRFPVVSKEAIENSDLQTALQKAMHHSQVVRNSVVDDFTNWEEMRRQAYEIKKYALDHLDELLLTFEKQCEINGTQVHFARDKNSAQKTILKILNSHQAKRVVKSKSMTTEEIQLNDYLEKNGIEVIETDLGEYIVQLRNEPPSHITGPAVHLNRKQIAETFQQKLKTPYSEDPETLTAQAKAVLREKFLSADAGITGVNFVCADTGRIVVIENEGNARLTTSIPKLHIAVCGIEKVIPSEKYLPLFLRMLARSATGQRINAYTNMLGSPKSNEEYDGPETMHIIFLDNNRSNILGDVELRESLLCIRCGACLNVCPVYSRVGGHSYGSSYMGPIGAVVTPQLQGVKNAKYLPFASSLCGACGDVCPVKVPLPHQILILRKRIADVLKLRPIWERIAFRVWRKIITNVSLYRFSTTIYTNLSQLGLLNHLKGWTPYRKPPVPAVNSFRQQWKRKNNHG